MIQLSNQSTYDLFCGRFQFSSEPSWLRLILALLVLLFFSAVLWKLPLWVIIGAFTPGSRAFLSNWYQGKTNK